MDRDTSKENLAEELDKKYYEEVHHLQLRSSEDNYFLYGYIYALGIKSVFEFGCNAGRHLKQLRKMGIKEFGIDINERAIEGGRDLWELNIELHDESYLPSMRANSYDVCMTVSVLNHIEHIDNIVKQLKRIASKHVIICECNTKNNIGTISPWYVHKYKNMGFERIRTYYANKVGAVYTMYKFDV